MQELMWVYFLDNILNDWKCQPHDSEDALLAILHREFPSPKEHLFKRKMMLSHMNHVLKSQQGTTRISMYEESIKPPELSEDYWRKVFDDFQALQKC